MYMFAMICDFFLYAGLLVTENILTMITIFFCFGLLSPIRLQVGFVYLMECMPTRYQSAATTAYFELDAIMYIVATFYFWKISKEWFWYCFIGYVWQFICIVCLFLIPESPRFLVSSGRMKEARKAFEKIAWWNRKEMEWDESLGEKLAQQKSTQFHILEVSNLPLDDTSETRFKEWLEDKVGDQLT